MSDAEPDAWYYTRDGDRAGPLAYQDLQELARHGELNPRLDMVWHVGMEAWQPAGSIEGLFEKRRRESLSDPALAEPYAPAREESSGEWMLREGGWLGARRRGYVFGTLILPWVWNFLFAFAANPLAPYLGADIMRVLTLAAAFVPIVFAIYFCLMRLINLGMSRWWILGNFVPVLNLWLGYRCFACPAGYAYHKKMDGVGIVLAILYWLLILLVLLALLVFVAMSLKIIDDPNLRDQIRDALDAAAKRSVRK